MGTGLVLPEGSGSTSAPAWVEVTEWHICDGSRPSSGQASDQANWWARPVSATTTDRSDERHAETAGSVESHIGPPTPSLLILHPGAPQRHSQIRRPRQGLLGGPGWSIYGGIWATASVTGQGLRRHVAVTAAVNAAPA